MAEWLHTSITGAKSVAPTTLQLESIGRYDKAAGSAGRENHARNPASFDHIRIPIHAQIPAGGNAAAVQFLVPYPMTLVAMQAAAEVINGATTVLTCDVLVDTGAGFVSVLDAVEDVLAGGAGVPTALFAPEDGSELLDYGDLVKVVFAATTNTADGASCTLLTQRR